MYFVYFALQFQEGTFLNNTSYFRPKCLSFTQAIYAIYANEHGKCVNEKGKHNISDFPIIK